MKPGETTFTCPKCQEERIEREIDDMANDGTLGAVAKHLAIDAGADWPSLDGDAQDAWHERAIEHERARLVSEVAA